MVTGSLFADQGRDMLRFEHAAAARGYRAIAGIDEAGRGALAGPVVAAAVILAEGIPLPGVDDSKKLTPRRREELCQMIFERALAVGIGMGDHGLIDRINILQATLHAMAESVNNLPVQPDFLLIDGIVAPGVPIPCQTIKKGDSASLSVAAASIIAKVTRDRLLRAAAETYPGYGFAQHKGYGSVLHLAAIAEYGPCPIHRRTFRGVREHVGHDATCW